MISFDDRQSDHSSLFVGPAVPPPIDEATEPQAHSAPNGEASMNTEPARQPSKSSMAAEERPKKKRSFLFVPSRSSSNKQQVSAAARDPQQEGSSGTGIVKRYRSASRASSRRSKRTQQPDAATTVEPKPTTSEMGDPSKTEKKSKGTSKLFAILSCCGSSGEDNEEPSLPAKKAPRPQSNHGRQSTPVEKAEVSAGESSAAESRDPNPFDEKAAVKASIDQKSPIVEDEESGTLPDQAEGSAVKKLGADEPLPVTNEARPGSLDQRPSSRRKPSRTSDPIAPPGPSEGVTHGQYSGPNIAESQAENTLEQDAAVSGQTSDQAQRDAEVAVAESDEDEDDPSIQASKQRDDTQQQLHNIPPPPPLGRDTGKQVPPVPMVDPDKQQWLLPPIQPRFHNRKCLVLDLDETLVHSSFKVGIYRFYSTFDGSPC